MFAQYATKDLIEKIYYKDIWLSIQMLNHLFVKFVVEDLDKSHNNKDI